MLIKTKISKILSKIKEDYKYFTFDLPLKLSKEKTGTRWIVKFECENGHTYSTEFKDGRKAECLYEGKEIWGRERKWGNDIYHLEYWWTKEEFERIVKKFILRAEESIEFDKKEIIRLKTLI